MRRQPDGKPGGTPGAAASNECTQSTRWVWRMRKIALPPEGQEAQRPEGPRPKMGGFPRKGQRVSLQITYGAGASAWCKVSARGRTWWVTGDEALLDVLRRVIGS